jgi:hypothetical protein
MESPLYFLQAEQGGPIKIGIEPDLNSVQDLSPYPLKVLAKIDASNFSCEKMLHTKFAALRSHGNWFHPDPSIFEVIEQIKEGKFHHSPKAAKNAVKWTSAQEQIVLGAVLGGSSLVKSPGGINYYLSMRGTHKDWLLYKMQCLNSLYKNQELLKNGNTYRCNSICCDELSMMQKRLYIGKNRSLTTEILDPLRDIGLAVWYLDGGSKTGRDRKNAYLNTTKFGTEGTQIVLEYFDSLGIEATVCRSRTRFRVLFTVEGTDRLMRIISPCFPEFMYHRI